MKDLIATAIAYLFWSVIIIVSALVGIGLGYLIF